MLMSLWLLWIPAQAEAGSLNASDALERTNKVKNESTVESIDYAINTVDYPASTAEADGIAEQRKNSRDILQAARQRHSALKGAYPTALETLHSAVLIRTTRVRQQIQQMTMEQLKASDRLQQTYQTSVADFKRFLVDVVEGIADQAHQTAEKLRSSGIESVTFRDRNLLENISKASANDPSTRCL